MTREEELDWLCRLRSQIYVYMPKEWLIPMNNALDMAIKTLEQEPILDKIRDEIEKLQKMCDKNDLNLMAQYSAFGMVLDILDKYKAEVEPQESEDKKEETEYQRQVEQYQYDTLYEPTFDLETGSM